MEGPPVITDGKDQRAEASPSSVMHAESQPADGKEGPTKAVDLEKRLNAMDARTLRAWKKCGWPPWIVWLSSRPASSGLAALALLRLLMDRL